MRVVKHRLAVDERELVVVRRAVELILGRGVRGTAAVASALNTEGLLPRQWSPRTKDNRELRWWAETVRDLLRSPHLKGVVTWGPEAIEIPAPALIEADEWDALQAALAGTRRRSYRAQRTYPLSGRLHCRQGRYVGSAYKGAPRYVVVGASWSEVRPLPAGEIEARVWEATCSVLLDREKLLALIPAPATDAEEAAMREQADALRRKVQDLEAASARLDVNLAKGVPSDQAAALARQELAQEYKEAQDHVARLETWHSRAQDTQARREQILTLADLDDALRGADLATQAHVYDVLDLHATLTAATAAEQMAGRIADLAGRDAADIAEDLTEFGDGSYGLLGADGFEGVVADGFTLTIAGQLSADPAARFMRTSASAGRR